MNRNDIASHNHDINKKYSNRMTCDKGFLAALKIFRPDLKVAYHHKLERFIIAFVNKETKMERILTIVQNTDGSFRQPDIRDIEYLRKYIMWDLLDEYPDPLDMWEAFDDIKRKEELADAKKRKQWILDFVKDRERQWNEAVDKFFMTGKTKDPYDKVNRVNKKITVDMGGHTKQGALYVPLTIKSEK